MRTSPSCSIRGSSRRTSVETCSVSVTGRLPTLTSSVTTACFSTSTRSCMTGTLMSSLSRMSPLDGTPLDDDLLVRHRHVHVALFGDDVLADRHLTRLLGARVRLQLLLM